MSSARPEREDIRRAVPHSIRHFAVDHLRTPVSIAGTTIRVGIDAAIVAGSYAIAFMVRFLLVAAISPQDADGRLASSFTAHYVSSVFVLLAIAFTVFSLSGFYTYGRRYRGRHKLLVVALSSSVAFLLFVAVEFVLTEPMDGQSRLVPFLAWLLATGLLAAARVSSKLWKRAVLVESRVLGVDAAGASISDILIIGGGGYIGSVLARQLLDAGYRVHILDAFFYGRESLRALEGDPRVKIIEADSRDIAAVAEAMRSVDAVVHLGEIVGDPACSVDEDLTVEVNLLATRVLAEIARGYGIRRFVYASSCSVYGVSDEAADEGSDLNPVSLYARAKIASEKAVLSHANGIFSPTVLRFATVYGWSHRPRFDLVVNLLTAKALNEGQITIFGGEQWRPFVHVADVATAIRLTLEAAIPVVSGEIFNVGSNEENHSIRELGELVGRLIPPVQVSFDGAQEDERSYRADFSKIRRRLGFEPRWTVEAGIGDMVSRLNAHPIDFRDQAYSNYRTFTDGSGIATIRSVDSVFREARAWQGAETHVIDLSDYAARR